MKILSSPARERDRTPLVDLSEITEVELLVLKRMREFTIGEHRSLFHGAGFDFVGLREWAPGDRFSAIDWPQSTLTNFTPLIVREFEQPTTANVVAVADGSLSTRCGVEGVPIAAAVARAVATIGLSAVFFQDTFGLMRFDGAFEHLAAVRPRTGKGQVMHCLEAYQTGAGLEPVKRHGVVIRSIAGFMRKTSMIPVVSDCLFEGWAEILVELAHVNAVHDVFLILIDAAFAFELPRVSAGWIEAFDVETGRSRVMSRGALRQLGDRVREWQDQVERAAKDRGLDVLRLGLDPVQSVIAITEFVMERRLRKTA